MKKSRGFYVVNCNGWGRPGSVAWYLTREEAERVARQLNYRGGTNYKVEAVAGGGVK